MGFDDKVMRLESQEIRVFKIHEWQFPYIVMSPRKSLNKHLKYNLTCIASEGSDPNRKNAAGQLQKHIKFPNNSLNIHKELAIIQF
jgi:hypothetical protein